MPTRQFPSLNLFLSTLFVFALMSISATTADVKLKKTTLLDGQIELKIPVGFTIMTDEVARVKYPSNNRPNLVYTDADGSTNVAMSLTTFEASQDVLEAYKNGFIQTFKKTFPKAEWLGEGIKEIGNRKVGFIELITPAEDTDVYNLIFFTDVHGKLLMCTFNCIRADLEIWQSKAQEIMQSIKVL